VGRGSGEGGGVGGVTATARGAGAGTLLAKRDFKNAAIPTTNAASNKIVAKNFGLIFRFSA
jgi:hypothetical protein